MQYKLFIAQFIDQFDILQLPPHHTHVPVRWLLFVVEKWESFVYPTLTVFCNGTTCGFVIKTGFKTAARANDVRRVSEFVIRRFFQFIVTANGANISCACLFCHKIINNYAHSKFSFPAPTSKWYLAMPRSSWA